MGWLARYLENLVDPDLTYSFMGATYVPTWRPRVPLWRRIFGQGLNR